MRKWQAPKKIKYESGRDPNFANEIMSMPWGEKLASCIQCGTCSGACPLSPYMDYTPRQIIALSRAGFKKEVLSSLTIWLCASCYACTIECPKQIKITDVMYALKQRAIQERIYPKRFPIPILAREFFDSVQRHGRNSEGRLILTLFLKTNPLRLLRQAWLGLRLLRSGRFSLRTESIEQKPQLQRLLQAVGREEGAK